MPSFNLVIEILIVDRAGYSAGGFSILPSFNLVIEILIVDRENRPISMDRPDPRVSIS